MKIAYFGNKLERHGYSPTGIDKLSLLLAEDHEVVTASHQRGQAARLIDMMRVLFKNLDSKFVLIDTYSTRAFFYAATIGRMCRHFSIPYIPILHGGELEARLQLSPAMCRGFFGGSYTNIAPSTFLQGLFDREGYAVSVIPNPLQLDDYDFKRRHEIRPRLLYVRSLARTYNPKLAVRVLHQLQRDFPSATLCMVGPDKDGTRAGVEALATTLGVTDQLKLTGKLAPVLWRELSGKYDIFINPTNVDNTPMSVVEAMALGLPVVSTNVGGLPFLITDGEDGMLAEAGNAGAFVEKIKFLVANPEEAARISWNARNKAETFSAENVRTLWNEVFHKKEIA